MKRRTRFVSAILIFLVLSFLGFARDKYLIYVTGERIPVLNSRTGEDRYRMPVSVDDVNQSISENPKWASAVVYSFIYLGLSALCIGFLFKDKLKILITITIHLALMVIAGFVVLTGLIMHLFKPFYIAAEYLKNLIQSPLLTLILIAGFMLVRPKNKD